MATRKKQNDTIYCGFHINDPKFSFGLGLNEGYTEHLNLKYFSDMIAVKSYPREMILATGIERIIGKEKMEQLFFDADLASLIKELEKYTSKKNAISIIHQIDILTESNNIKKTNIFLILKEEISKIIEQKEGESLFSTHYKLSNEKVILDYLYEDILIEKKEKFKQTIFESLMKEEQEKEKKLYKRKER